jgi:hypothetical protein
MRVTRRDILPNKVQAGFTPVLMAHAIKGLGWSVSSTLAR